VITEKDTALYDPSLKHTPTISSRNRRLGLTARWTRRSPTCIGPGEQAKYPDITGANFLLSRVAPTCAKRPA
jgi:hypothetical protein